MTTHKKSAGGRSALSRQGPRRIVVGRCQRRAGAAYLRLIVLIQAEPRRTGIETLDAARVRAELINNHRILAEAIIIATGEERGLEPIEADYPLGISDPACNVSLTEGETEVLKASVTTGPAAAAIVEAAKISCAAASEFFQTPAERGERFRIPQLAIRQPSSLAPLLEGEGKPWVLFDDPEVLEHPWDLAPCDAAPTADDWMLLGAGLTVSEGGEMDVDAAGKLVPRFLPELQRDLGLAYPPEHWDAVRLAAWLCRNLPEPSLTHASKQAFVAAWLAALLQKESFTLARANLQKFLIRNLLEARIRALRQQAATQAFQQTLFGDDAATRVAVSDLYASEFHPQAYAPSRDDDGRFGHFDFRGHYYGRIGDFDSKEEFECACWLDTQAQRGRLQFWVRNLVRREGCAFFLQKADDRFYPDFLCQLPGAILTVEYKGADRWKAAEDDRLIGGLWAELSGGCCRFIMVKEKRWDWIEERLH